LSGKLRDWVVSLYDRLSSPGFFYSVSEPAIALPPMPTSSDSSPVAGRNLEHCPSMPPVRSLREAIQWTVLYGSVFDYPLTRDEVYRFLMAPGGSRAEVEVAVGEALARGGLEIDGVFLYPPGRSASVTTRLRRGQCARQVWTRARFYARLIWSLPYVRMVAVTGALAVDNVEKGDDIDFMVVAEPGRVWMTRGMILLVARFARARGDTLCPNYIISMRALELEERDPYTAHELAQMVPIHGREVAQRFWTANAWCQDFLPNAWWRGDEGTDDRLPWMLMTSKALGQLLLDLPLGALIERWEQRRKIAKLAGDAPLHARETQYTPDVCKGHADSHGSRILDRWAVQVAQQHRQA
jgi:hypothetical protein